MPILFIFFFIPAALGAVLEYGFCRVPKRRLWRLVPPAGIVLLAAVVTLVRYFGWNEGAGGAPVETLLFFPGLPALGLLVGVFAGWRLWKRLWNPQIIRTKKK